MLREALEMIEMASVSEDLVRMGGANGGAAKDIVLWTRQIIGRYGT